MLFLLAICLRPTLADFEAGRLAFEKGDYRTAVKEWMPLAEHGNAEAQRRIGGLYEAGQGVARSEAVALNWYRRAARQGNVKALAELGWICPHQNERAQLLLGAEKPLLRLADAGDPEAQTTVARI
jgi:TPR repeat protein